MELALVGNPNCGKTTLFNLLTGSNQRVGNWSGVTVECKLGLLHIAGQTLRLVDLPGIYTLTAASVEQSLDEQIACEYILSGKADCIINVLDASQLERSLYLTLQLLEANIPIIVVLNMLDVAIREQMDINLDQLSAQLHCPVIGLVANKKRGIDSLKNALITIPPAPHSLLPNSLPIVSLVDECTTYFQALSHPRWFAMQYLEGDITVRQRLTTETYEACSKWLRLRQTQFDEAFDIMIARARFDVINTLLKRCFKRPLQVKAKWIQHMDHLVLNRWLGLPIFLLAMYGLFVFAINLGGVLQRFFDQMSQLLFVDLPAMVLYQSHVPAWLTQVLTDGIGAGLSTTVTFIPVIGAMFFALAFLESCGYMARGAFVMDRLMRVMGLPGKSFVPMIIGFGCNVPAVLAARTLESRRDRILTIIMSPFMSCGARLAIYAAFVAAFFPTGGQYIIFSLYLIGILMAVLTGLMLRKTVLDGDPSPFIMTLPDYHWPTLKVLGYTTWFRLKGFLRRAVSVIVPLCLLLSCLNTFTVNGHLTEKEGSDNPSILSIIGYLASPVVEPMGISTNNWPATVGLMTGMISKEVVVGTLNTLYRQGAQAIDPEPLDIGYRFKQACLTIPNHIRGLGKSLYNPIAGSAPEAITESNFYGELYRQFGSQSAAYAYLLFLLLYFPCISTTAVMLKELNRGWTTFSVVWTTGLAYLTSVSFYQVVTFKEHPMTTAAWLIAYVMFVATVILFLRHYRFLVLPDSKNACITTAACRQCGTPPNLDN